MPLHDGSTDTTKMIEANYARTALICARLYLRGGKRHLHAGYSRAGLAALYDAVLFGIRYYVAKHKSCNSLMQNVDPWDASGLFYVLARAGVFKDPRTFNRYSLKVERALWQESYSFNIDSTLAEVEKMLMKLGLIPFHLPSLPDESPLTP